MRIDHAFFALKTVMLIRVSRLARLLAENSTDQIDQITAIFDFVVLTIVFFIRYVLRTFDQEICFFIEFFEQIRDDEVKIDQKLNSFTLSTIQLLD
jgi:hypothetical protein